MAAIRPVLNDFSAGELSPKLAGRVDLGIYHKGAQEITNFRVRSQGGVTKRPGTAYVQKTYIHDNASLNARLIPFVIDSSTVFIVELTAGLIRFLDVGSGDWVALSGGAAVEISTSYSEAEVFEVQYAQAHCQMYLVHPEHPPVYIKYDIDNSTPTTAVMDYTTDDQSFMGNVLEWTTPTAPYETYDLWEQFAQWLIKGKTYVATGRLGRTVSSVVRDDLSIVVGYTAPESKSGAVTTNNSDTLTGFTVLTVDGYKGFMVSGAGIPVGTYILSNTATTMKMSQKATASATITLSIGSLILKRGETYVTGGTLSIDITPFMGSGNYPGVVAFFAGRCWMGATKNDPAMLWASKPFDYKNFVVVETIEYTTQVKTDDGDRIPATGKTTVGSKSVTDISPTVDTSVIGRYATGTNLAYGTKVSARPYSHTVTLDMAAITSGTCGISFSNWKNADVPEYVEEVAYTQQIGAGNAFRIQLQTEEDESILWIAGSKDLYIGTSSSEWVIPSGTNAIQARAVLVSRFGSSNVQARFIGQNIMFVTPSSRAIRSVAMDSELVAPFTHYADHMVAGKVKQMDFSQSPEVALYAVTGAGELIRCLIEPGAGVMAWDRTELRAGDSIMSVCVVPWVDGDRVYIVAKRVIAGATVYCIEYFKENDDLALSSEWYLDCAKVWAGSASTHITGFGHLAGQLVTVRYISSATELDATTTATVASDGNVTIPSATYAIVGLPYSALLKTHRIEASNTEGLTKGVSSVFFRLYRSFGFTLSRVEHGDAIPVSPDSEPFTGPIQVMTDIPFLVDAELVITSDDPVPVGIQTIVPETEIGG